MVNFSVCLWIARWTNWCNGLTCVCSVPMNREMVWVMSSPDWRFGSLCIQNKWIFASMLTFYVLFHYEQSWSSNSLPKKVFYGHTAYCVMSHYFFMFRGPSYGYRGKVLLRFEENPLSKIGVRFDKAIPDGVDLGGLCEENHGFFCNGDAFNLVYLISCGMKLVKF